MGIAGSNQDIQDILTKYGAIGVAAGPLTASVVARLIVGKSKMMTAAIRLSVGWAAARTFLTPHIDQMQGTLKDLIGIVHNGGY